MKTVMIPRVRPIGDYLTIVEWDGEDACDEGVSVHDRSEKLSVGVVLMVGPDVRTLKKAPRIQQGQRVLYNRCAGAEMSIDGGMSHFIVLREGDVCGILEEVTDLQRIHEMQTRELILAN